MCRRYFSSPNLLEAIHNASSIQRLNLGEREAQGESVLRSEVTAIVRSADFRSAVSPIHNRQDSVARDVKIFSNAANCKSALQDNAATLPSPLICWVRAALLQKPFHVTVLPGCSGKPAG